jgi:hypothetical protein
MSDWDILNLDENEEWAHFQILDRLHSEGISCYYADIFFGDNLAFLIGCKDQTYDIANALNIPEDVIYNDFEHCFVILNLYQLKAIRSGYAKNIEEYENTNGFEV